MHCKIKECLLIRDLKPILNENVGSEKLSLLLAYSCRFMSINFVSSQSVQWVVLFEFKFICKRKIISSDDVCCNIRNVKFLKVMQLKQMFVTAVCVLFLLKLKWPKSKKLMSVFNGSVLLLIMNFIITLSKYSADPLGYRLVDRQPLWQCDDEIHAQ